MANPQIENGYIRIANEIWDEVIRRDFTKRQKDILFLIWRLSYGCQRRDAYIPRMKNFELCGVSETKIKAELEYLERSRVLIWDRENKLFEIRKDYENWYVNLVKSWDEDEFTRLLAMNLHQKTSQNGKKIFPKEQENLPETGSFNDQDNESNFPKREENLPETGTETSQNGNKNFPKREDRPDSNPWGSKVEEGCKDIKDIKNKDSSSTKVIPFVRETESGGNHNRDDDFSFSRIYQAYEKNFTRDGRVTEFEIDELEALFDDYGGEWVIKAMRETFRQEPEKRKLSYVRGVLQGYETRGGPDANKAQPPEPAPVKYVTLDYDDPIVKRMLELEASYAQHGTS